jgi:hypothetical protein
MICARAWMKQLKRQIKPYGNFSVNLIVFNVALHLQLWLNTEIIIYNFGMFTGIAAVMRG